MIRHLVLRYLAKKSCPTETGTESNDSAEEHENEAIVPLSNDDLGTRQTDKTETEETNL